MGFFTWFGRSAEKERAYARLNALREAYAAQGDRVIRLSARTDLARKSAGSTQHAFSLVEQAFAAATGEYARVMELIEQLEAGLARGKVGDFLAAEKVVQGLGPKLDELDRQLATWEARWQQVPREIEEVAHALAQLRLRAEAAAAALGAPLPLSERLAHMEQHLERTRRTLAEGNPVEAGHLVNDLRIALEKLEGQCAQYTSGAGAVAQAERDLAEAKERLSALPTPGAEAVGAIAAAEALLPRLRPALAAGQFDQFQQDLLQIQRHLTTARASR